MASIKLNNYEIFSQSGDAAPKLNNSTGLNFSTTNQNFTIKGIDAPIVGATNSSEDNPNSGQLAIYNGDTKLWGINESGWVQNPNVPCIAGQLGGATNFVSDALILFEEFWVQQGITYNSTTRRFTVPIDGIYRITMNPFFKTGVGAGRVLIGVNNDSPAKTTHYGHCYRESSTYDTGCLDSVVSLSSGDYIVYRMYSGELYNQSNDKFNQFSIQMIG